MSGQVRADAGSASNRYGRTSELELRAECGPNGGTVLARAYATQPYRVMKPLADPGNRSFAQVITMSSSAGLLEGDRQRVRVGVGAGAALSVRAQSFEKVHRMDGSGRAERATLLSVASGGRLRFVQQPVIPYAGSRFEGETTIELADATAGVAFSEVVACGRAAAGERFSFDHFASRVLVAVSGVPVFADNLVLEPAVIDVAGLGMFEGFTHMASLAVVAPDLDEARFEAARCALRALTGPAFAGPGAGTDEDAVAPFSPGGALVGGVTHVGDAAGAGGWAVRLLGDRAQDLQRTLDLVARLAGF